MKTIVTNMWQEEEGVLSFEWTIIITVLVIGVVSGLAGARDAMIDELADIAEATLRFDQSFSYAGIPECDIPPVEFVDDVDTTNPQLFQRCDRASAP